MDTISLHSDDSFHRPKSQSWIRGWWREILSMAVSLACTVCLVSILIAMKDRPHTAWAVPFVSLPAMLSILTTISKSTTALALAACMSQYKWIYFKERARKLSDLNLLDDASRGPNGSLFLLLEKPLALASLGAVAIILSLSLEPSVQQIVNLTPRNRTLTISDQNVFLKLAHRYDGGATGPLDRYHSIVDTDSAETENIDIPMQAAMYSGLYNLDTPPVFSCPSNCSWPDTYVSLGFKSNCTDVTDEVFRRYGISHESFDSGDNIITPGNITLDVGLTGPDSQSRPVVVIRSRALFNGGLDQGPVDNKTAPVHRVDPNIARIAVFRHDTTGTSRRKNITECDISVVAYKYSEITVINDKLVEGKEESISLQYYYYY
ncbi:hypothetical protein QBC38DRAFT_428130 [Podospora fimiseda]|uniref:Uncharacterized protein n=1 Tax=Podospora fimiseda TaxID=252190 RepID=A0AAN6YNZ2_9PEZI|nr:hypothetical protein QBC38DRAFT_428130 [Podospora fimiseda]